eukprot:8225301-Ditylum_brightwellii.AAC.1
MGAIKGKTTRTRPIPVTSKLIEMPVKLVRMNEDTSISHEIYHRTSQYVKDTLAVEYEKSLDEIKALYDRGGFTITKIHCDNKCHKTMDSFVTKHTPPIR